MNDLERKKLHDLVKLLEAHRGRHTELVSFYIPDSYDLNKAASQIFQEKSTSQNIKSKAVRKNVTAALEKIVAHLKNYRQTPPNGLAIFCGNTAEKEGQTDIEIFVINPPVKINTKLYHCGQTFILEPLKDIIREREVYGIIVVDKSEGNIGIIKGKNIETLASTHSIVPGKTKAGGQSAARFSRVREGLLNDHLKKVAEMATTFFRQNPDMMGIIVGGPGGVKDQFVKENYLQSDLQQKILGVVDISYTGHQGMAETLERGQHLIEQAAIVKEKKILDRFFEELAKEPSLAVYGIREVVSRLKEGNLQTLMVSEKFDFLKAQEILGTHVENFEEELVKAAQNMGASYEVISAGTPRGEQFLSIGGIGGIMRYIKQ